MKKCYFPLLTTFVLLFGANSLLAQKDCCTAREVTFDMTFPFIVETNSGAEKPDDVSCSCLGGEGDSYWLHFSCLTSGKFDFMIEPKGLEADYDWALFSTYCPCKSPDRTVACDSAGPAPGGPFVPTGASNDPMSIFGVPGATEFQPSIQLEAGTNYYLLISNVTGNGVGFTLSLGGDAVIGPPILTQLGDLSGPSVACPGGTGTFSVPFNPNITGYLWEVQPGNDQSVSTNVEEIDFFNPGTYEVCVTGFEGSCYPTAKSCKTVVVQPIAPSVGTDVVCIGEAYEVGNGEFLYGPGTYNVTFESWLGCDSVVLLTLLGLPTDFNVVNKILCEGSCVDFDGQTRCDPGIYEQVLTNRFGCDSTTLLNFITIPLETMIEGADTLSCKKPNITLDGSGSIGGTGMTYTWKKNGITVGTDTTLTISSGGTYTLITRSFVGTDTCFDETSVTIPTNLLPPQGLSAIGDTINCTTTLATLSGNSTTAGVTWAWAGPGGFTSTLQNPTTTVAGTYQLTVTGTNGCKSTASALVVGDTAPPNATASGGTITCASPNATLAGNSTTPGAAFSWTSPSGTVIPQQNPTVAAAGTYTLTVTAPNGCTKTATAVVAENTTPPMAVANANGVLNCNAASVLLSGSGSSTGAQVVYAWTTTNGQITAGETSLTPTVNEPGTYTLTVTNNANGCTNTASTTVSESPAVSATIAAQTNVLCFGDATGSATIAGSGGNGVFTYEWSNGATEATPTGLIAGTYAATITDGEGCTATASTTISQPTALSTNAFATPQSAVGVDDGTATCNPDGGVPPYTVLWSNGETTTSISGLAPENYTVTITDANGCFAAQTVTVSASNCVVKANLDFVDVSCPGASDGSATINLDNATPPFIFLWSNGDTTQTISDLPGGNYSVTSTDANGCEVVSSVTIAETPTLSPNATTTDLSGINSNDGTATATPTGGTPDYTYLWSTGDTDFTIVNLAPGEYTVTVTDMAGCQSVQTVEVLPFNCGLGVDLVASDASCAGANDGQATASPLGGTAPFSYLWSNGAATATITDLAPATYEVTITDDSGCPAIASVAIGEPALLEVETIALQPADCGLENGQATVGATGGTPGYTFIWSTDASGETISDLAYGDYTVTATDNNGCESVFSLTIGVNDNIAPNALAQDLTVYLGGNGTASIGTNEVDNGSTDDCEIGTISLDLSEFDCSMLGANEVTLTVTDIAGNSATASAIVTVLDTTPPVVLAQSVTVFLDAAGNTTLTADQLDNGSSDNCGTPDLTLDNAGFTCSDLGEATVTLTATDASGNAASVQVAVTVADNLPPAIDCPASFEVSSCDPVGAYEIQASDNCKGNITLSLTDGLESGATFPTGVTTVAYEATDAGGNSSTCSFQVTVAQVLSATLTTVEIECEGDETGSLTANPTGGTPGYSYLWSTGSTGASISGLPAGDYSVTITDAFGCTMVMSKTLTEPPLLVVSLVAITNATNNQSNGSIDVTATGGTPPLTYTWTDLAGNVLGTQEDIGGLAAGTYQLLVTDANGCESQSGYTIQSTSTGTSDLSLGDLVKIYPNPTPGQVIVELTGMAAQLPVGIEAFDVTGRQALTYQSGPSTKHVLDLSGRAAGVYLLKIWVGNEMLAERLIVTD